MSVLDIFNQALSLVGGRHTLASTGQSSVEAEQCRIWYTQSRDFVFRKAYWPSIRETAVLALISERNFAQPWVAGDPPPPWQFAYAFPADAFAVQHIYNGAAPAPQPNEYTQGQARFSMEIVDGQRAILTQIANAVATYTVVVDDPARWDVNLYMAVVHSLASNLSMALVGRPDVAQAIFQKAEYFAQQALESQANNDARRINDPFVDTAQSRTGMMFPLMGPQGGGPQQ